MKKIVTCTFILLTLKMFSQHSVELVWKSEPVFEFSEGVVNSKNNEFLYVSNTIGNPMERDGKGTISTIDFKGKLLNKDIITGMNAPKDIQRYNDLLYAADLDELVVIDLNQSKIINKIKIEGTNLLHNITIDSKGTVYVSDMFSGKVFKVENGIVSLYVEGLGYAAGMLIDKNDLLVLTGGNLIKVDSNKKIITLSKGMDSKMNGLVKINNNEFVATSWAGVMYYINADGSNQVLLDTRDKNIVCGIIFYDKVKNVIYMTTDTHDRLYAYKLK